MHTPRATASTRTARRRAVASPQPEYIENAENNLNSVLDNVSLEYSRKIPGFLLIVK